MADIGGRYHSAKQVDLLAFRSGLGHLIDDRPNSAMATKSSAPHTTAQMPMTTKLMSGWIPSRLPVSDRSAKCSMIDEESWTVRARLLAFCDSVRHHASRWPTSHSPPCSILPSISQSPFPIPRHQADRAQWSKRILLVRVGHIDRPQKRRSRAKPEIVVSPKRAVGARREFAPPSTASLHKFESCWQGNRINRNLCW